MALHTETRRAGPFLADGTTVTYPFNFKLFNVTELAVNVSYDGGTTESAIATDLYTVTLNANQDEQPGGYVTLNTAIEEGAFVSIVSDVKYLQEVVFTNRGGFYPEVLNQSLDRLTIMAQQLKESTDRAITVPSTSDKTPQQLAAEILGVASQANDFAEAAKQTYEQVLQTQREVEELRDTAIVDVTAEGTKQIVLIKDEGSAQVGTVEAEGDKQVERLQNIADFEESGSGVRCTETDWVVSSAVAEGATITVPNNFIYVAGRDHLRVSVNGLTLLKDENFSEVGEADTESSEIVFNMPLAVGDEVQVWTVPLGRGGTDDLIARVKTLEDALSELSRTVVYKE